MRILRHRAVETLAQVRTGSRSPHWPALEVDFHAPDHRSGNCIAFGFGERKLWIVETTGVAPRALPPTGDPREACSLLWPEPAAGGPLLLEKATPSVHPEECVLGAPQIRLAKDRLTGEKPSDGKLQSG